jgi:alpha-glucosidase
VCLILCLRYGLYESRATNQALTAIRGARPFVLSRSTFAGSGAWTAHWTGDNGATWRDLKGSVVTMLTMALLGVPMVGADICGFLGQTNDELCTRWIQVGAFYPFSRDHSTIDAPPHELYKSPAVAAVSRTVLTMRYRLLPYLYTGLYEAHSSGAMLAKPLFAAFPQDHNTHDIDDQ